MAKHIKQTTLIQVEGNIPKQIEEFIGLVNSATPAVSIAMMKSSQGWSEPGQRPDFDEYSIVLKGSLHIKVKNKEYDVGAGQAFIAGKNEWVQYSSPCEEGAEYISVCLPAFSPQTVNRD